MKQHRLLTVCLVLCTGGFAAQAQIELQERAFNVDGTVYNVPFGTAPNNVDPAGANLAGFNTDTGLGSISYHFSGAGPHYLAAFFDSDIDAAVNTFFNEKGLTHNSLGFGQSWEIGDPYADSPGNPYSGLGIYDHFKAGSLANANSLLGLGVHNGDDVSLALGWQFSLAANQSAEVDYIITTSQPRSGFYLQQIDPDSQKAIYFYSTLTYSQPGVPDVRWTFGMLAGALIFLASIRICFGRSAKALTQTR